MESKDKKLHLALEYLQKLGLDELTAKLYIALSEKGPMSVLDASRAIGVERTRVYRLAELLTQKGLIEEVADYKKQILQATDIKNLEILVKEHEENSKILKEGFPSFSSTLMNLGEKSPFTKVLYYRGTEGIKQMFWNQLNAKNEVVCFTYRNIEEVVGIKFWRTWVYEFEQRRNLKLRELRTELFYESLKEMKSHTIMQYNQWKNISTKLLPIKLESDIYNDVTSMLDWKDGEVFGVEIYNQKIADMQKHFFETFWNLAKPDKKALKLLKEGKNTQ